MLSNEIVAIVLGFLTPSDAEVAKILRVLSRTNKIFKWEAVQICLLLLKIESQEMEVVEMHFWMLLKALEVNIDINHGSK